jgi:GT2 family glycosyltransferase/glycosyltransferase involved in cell wall biosynthesis
MSSRNGLSQHMDVREAAATVIVPTVIGGPRLPRLLESLGSSDGVEVLVVDNASPDRDLGGLGSRFPGVEVIRLERNVGYSRAINLAARRARSGSLVLLNDDCVCDPGYVEAIVAPLDPAVGVTMAAGVMREARDPSRIDTAGMQLDRTLLVFDYLNGEPVSLVDRGVPDPIGPAGVAAAFDREAFLSAGGFDENLFAYWEDSDLVLRMRATGQRCVLAPGARGVHEHSATLGPGSRRKDYLTGFGRGYMLHKWGVLGNPGRATRTLVTDGVICLGQVAIDRNVAGFAGRIRGFRAVSRAGSYPAEQLRAGVPGDGMVRTFRRRLSRRARLRREPLGAAERRAPRGLAIFHVAETCGPLRSLEAELRWLADAGSLDVVVPGPGQVAETFKEVASVTELDYEALMLPNGPLGLPRTLRRIREQTNAFGELLREKRPDFVLVVSTMLPAALLAARREGVPAVVYASELHRGPEVESELRRIGGMRLLSLTQLLSSELITCSKAVADQFPAWSRNGRRRAPATTIYPPIPNAYGGGDAAAFRARHGIHDATSCILTVGNVTRGRGQDLLIEALPAIRQAVPGAQCVIVGPTFDRPKDVAFERALVELCRERGLTDAVTLTGEETRIADAYAAASVVVNPARTPESFGRVACEALVAGRPVVATRVGAVTEALSEDGRTRLISPEDPAALAAAVIATLRDSALSEPSVREDGAAVLRRFAPESSMAAFREVIQRVAPIPAPSRS